MVDVRAHDREVAKNRPPRVSRTVPEQPDLRVPTRSRCARTDKGVQPMTFLEGVLVEQDCAMVRFGNKELVLRT